MAVELFFLFFFKTKKKRERTARPGVFTEGHAQKDVIIYGIKRYFFINLQNLSNDTIFCIFTLQKIITNDTPIIKVDYGG
jgi:hypothetical protein